MMCDVRAGCPSTSKHCGPHAILATLAAENVMNYRSRPVSTRIAVQLFFKWLKFTSKRVSGIEFVRTRVLLVATSAEYDPTPWHAGGSALLILYRYTEQCVT